MQLVGYVWIGNTYFKGTPGVLKHYSGLSIANPGGPLNPIPHEQN